jgi:dTDP-L-rhamnose 4-epimerase
MGVVVIGGAGFIGSHHIDTFVNDGYHLRILDNVDPQMHPSGLPPGYLNPNEEFVQQGMRDRADLEKDPSGADAVFHLARAVGVGDSTYLIHRYAETSVLGGANPLDIVANEKHSMCKIALAFSVPVYGEGKNSCPRHGIVFPSLREMGIKGAASGKCIAVIPDGATRSPESLVPLQADEGKPVTSVNDYAITKHAQEDTFLAVGRAYMIPAKFLRYLNLFGSRQVLSNPDTGVAKIFALQFAQGKVPLEHKDGLQSRGFIRASDVVQANILALSREETGDKIFSVGTGQPISVLGIMCTIAKRVANKAEILPAHECRAGDVRQCWADITKIRMGLGFEPHKIFPAGLDDLLAQAGEEQSSDQKALGHAELVQRDLIS